VIVGLLRVTHLAAADLSQNKGQPAGLRRERCGGA